MNDTVYAQMVKVVRGGNTVVRVHSDRANWRDFSTVAAAEAFCAAENFEITIYWLNAQQASYEDFLAG